MEKDNNYKGYGILRLFKGLLLQFMEDLSDRELEMFLRDNVSSKWFCGFGLTEVTPDHTVFTRVRERIGTKRLSPSGLINKVAVTPANVTNAKGLKNVCPDQGAIYADKGYCVEPAKRTAKKNGYHLAAIKKNNMKEKNKDLNRWHSEIRAPYERVFANTRKRTRYGGVMKNQFAAFMEAIGFNLKRLVALSPPGFIWT